MGRKKKSEITSQEQTPNVNTIEVKDNTAISYKGTVQIQIKRGDKIISNKVKRNKGALQMFSYLAYCLAGELKANLIPNYIALLNHNDSSNILLSKLIEKNSVYIENNVVSYQFLIPYNAIITAYSSIDCNRLILTNSEKSQAFLGTIPDSTLDNISSAIMDLTNSIQLHTLNSNDAIIIVWSMEIKNYN